MDNLKAAPASMREITIKTHPDRNAAIGLAASFVAPKAPFAAYRADQLVSAIVGQIQRRHYAFAVREGRIVGYVGWALCSAEVAEAWLLGGVAPRSEQCRTGEAVVPVIVAADDAMALRHLARHVRGLYPNHPYLGRRIRAGGGHTHRGRIRPAATP